MRSKGKIRNKMDRYKELNKRKKNIEKNRGM